MSAPLSKKSMIARTRTGRKKRSMKEFGRNPFRTCRGGRALDKRERAEVIRIIENTFGVNRINDANEEMKNNSGLISIEKKDGKRRKMPHPRIVLGINAITRRIERGQRPRLVVILSEIRGKSAALSQHLSALASYKDIPVYSISKASYVLSRVFGVKNVAAFAVRDDDEGRPDTEGHRERVNSATERLSKILPKITVPLFSALKRAGKRKHGE